MGIKKKLSIYKKRSQEYLAKRPHRSFKITKKPRGKAAASQLPGVYRLIKDTFLLIWQEKKLFLSLGAIYILVIYFAVGNNISQSDFVDLRDAAANFVGGSVGSLGTALTLVGSTMDGVLGQTTDSSAQLIFAIITFIFWLAIVWMLRMRLADNKITVRDALYNCGSPLVPSLLVFAVIMAQLTPGAIAIFIYGIAQSGGYLQGGIEVMAFVAAAALLVGLSVYWICGSLTAMIIVTLPGMRPWNALRAASELVIGRRWSILIRLIALGVLMYVVWLVVLLVVMLIDGWLKFDWLPLLPVTAQILSAFMLVYIATYVYKMYRGLL